MEKLAELLRFVLVVVGLIHILTRSLVFRQIRMWFARQHIILLSLVYCPSCSGFWIGLALAPLWPWFGWSPQLWIHAALQAAVSACGIGGALGALVSFDSTVQYELEELRGTYGEGNEDDRSGDGNDSGESDGNSGDGNRKLDGETDGAKKEG